MSLLDFNMPEMDSPQGQGLLAAAFSLMGAKGPSLSNAIGQAGGQYMNTYQTAKENAAQAELRRLQIDAYKQKMEQEKAALEVEKRKRQAASRSIIPAVAATPDKPLNLVGDTGPNLYSTSPSNMVGGGTEAKPASFDHDAYIQELYKMELPEQALEWQAKIAKDDAPVKLAPGESLFSGKASGYKPLLSVPKPEEKSAEQKGYELYKSQGGQLGWFEYQQALKRAGASNQTVINEGQKGFDNTLKLRGDFRSEPIYKAHGEVQSAHSQISTALKQSSPAGDLAGATKLMKILDPGSVVRESELGMAMAASGLLDRASNYASMVLNGTKLTPTQRKDFQALADALMEESKKQYNAKRAEYKGIADRNGLNVTDVVGPDMNTELQDPMGIRNRKKPQYPLNAPQANPADPLGIFR